MADVLVAHPPGSQLDASAKGAPVFHASKLSKRTLSYAVMALAWAISAMSALSHSSISTGTVCPVGWRSEPLTPLFQLLMCGIDAYILVQASRFRHLATEEGTDISQFLASLLFTSAACVFFICIPGIPTDANFFWATDLHYVDIQDLLLDSVIASTVLLCGLFLMISLHPTTIALIVTSFGVLGSLLPSAGTSTVLPPLSQSYMAGSLVITVALLAPLWATAIMPTSAARSSTATTLHKWLVVCNLGLIALCALRAILFPSPPIDLSLRSAVDSLMSTARTDAEQWAAQATTSRSLVEAVAEYKKRNGIPPPPNFDKWYEFAVSRDSAVIDDYRQIQEDLLPFWGMKPEIIRGMTTHLFEYSGLETGGVRIRNGVVEQSPHIPGTHRWMTDSLQKMIEPFARWLPDMDLAINLSDECRVAVPFEDMQILKDNGRSTKLRLNEESRLVKGSKDDKNFWPQDFPEPQGDYSKTQPSPFFTRNIRRMIYYDSVAATCPPDSMARNNRWWDWSKACVECAAPHSLLTYDGGAIMANTTLADSLCHQPDIAYLDGFVMSPSAMVGTNLPFPIFSQGRVGGFSDILIPSPWNYDEKSMYEETAGMTWDNKNNGLFWRGSLSDGYAAFGTWAGFLRARFAREAYEKSTQQPTAAEPFTVNVSFTGELGRCHSGDCAAERATFRKWSGSVTDSIDSATQLAPKVPFEEHWRFRHLLDMDGSGFSGRFVPFLLSNSLVYRAALFRTWFDERLTPWYHYVPVDIRLGRGFWSVLEMLAGGSGDESARAMAAQGKDLAKKALRQEDSQVYMFRLLLEWGRVVNDNREHVGYTG